MRTKVFLFLLIFLSQTPVFAQGVVVTADRIREGSAGAACRTRDIRMTNAGVVLSCQSNILASPPVSGAISPDSVSITGTAGAGFLSLAEQSSAPSQPSNAIRLYANASNGFVWKDESNVVRTVAPLESPAFTTPNLGTPSAGVLTNATGLPISTGVSGLGTNVATALGVNIGSAGAVVVLNGALGTPSSGTATNLTGLPLTTGVTGVLPVANGGTNASSASITAFNNITGYTAAGATGTTSTNLVFSTSPVLVTPDLGTPSAVTLTNATGLPISTGVSGLGTGIATALGVNTGSAGAPVLFNGAGGTPSSLTLTNATGLPPTTGISGWPANASGVLTNNGSGTLSWTAGGSGITIGTTTVTSGSATRLLYETSGNVVGEISGATSDGTTLTVSSGNLVATRPKFTTSIDDSNGNELIILTATGSAVNEWTLANGSTGVNPKLTASGETNVGLDFQVKGTGVYRLLATASGPADLRFFEDTDNGSNYVSIIAPSSMSGDRVATLFDATDTVVGKATTDTFTNKTMTSVGAGGTNTFTLLEPPMWFDAAGVVAGVAVNVWNLPSANAPVAAAIVGTNTIQGVLDFADGSNDLTFTRQVKLPTGFTGTMDVNFKWLSSTTSGNVIWGIATACVADGETNDPSFNSYSDVTDATKGTTNQTNDAAIATVTITGCAAGELMHVKGARRLSQAGDTMAGTARLIGVELIFRRAQ